MEYILNEPLMDPAALVLVWGNCEFELAVFDCDASNLEDIEFHISNIFFYTLTYLKKKYLKLYTFFFWLKIGEIHKITKN